MNAEKEKVLRWISEKGLTSYMNDTKWLELQTAMNEEMPFPPPYILKSLFEDKSLLEFGTEVSYHGGWDDEAFLWGDFYKIEWIKIRPRYLLHQGRLISPKLMDATDELISVLKKYSIPYEEDDDGAFIIFGYK